MHNECIYIPNTLANFPNILHSLLPTDAKHPAHTIVHMRKYAQIGAYFLLHSTKENTNCVLHCDKKSDSMNVHVRIYMHVFSMC